MVQKNDKQGIRPKQQLLKPSAMQFYSWMSSSLWAVMNLICWCHNVFWFFCTNLGLSF